MYAKNTELNKIDTRYELLLLTSVVLLIFMNTTIIQGYVLAANSTSNLTAPSNNISSTNVLASIKNQKLDASILPTLNASVQKVAKTGTLEINKTQIPIKYDKVGNLPIFEDDIILTSSNEKAAVDKFITSHPWTNGTIPVGIHPDLQNKERVINALSYVMSTTPIKFKPIELDANNKPVDHNYIVFIPHPEKCSSNVGMVGGPQAITVADWCQPGNLVHEIGHLLGLWHEQTRCDRDQYVTVEKDNIKPDWLSQFSALCDPNNPNSEDSPTSFGKYDYCSIMHYPGFSNTAAIDPTKPVITPTHPVVGCKQIGQREAYSQGDLNAIFNIYSLTSTQK
jgi:hypothetical protein